MTSPATRFSQRFRSPRASVLIMVLWICFGLVALTLYFANSMSAELRAADNRAVTMAAQEAVAGGARYVSYILGNFATGGVVPLVDDYKAEMLPVGDAYFWLIGRDPDQRPTNLPVFGLVDECGKLNLNTATLPMLEALPGMPPELAAAIIDWRDTNEEPSPNGAEDETYGRLTPARRAKNGPFETVDELRLVYGATMEILLGEDTNRNGCLDRNEDNAEESPPMDDRDGQLFPGILEYVTVYSQQPNTRSNGSRRINVTTIRNNQPLGDLLTQKFGGVRTFQLLSNVGDREVRSVAEFFVNSRMTADEFVQIHKDITTSAASTVRGLVNVNSACEAVLACLPGIGVEKAPALVAYRLAHPDALTSIAWLAEVLDPPSLVQAGRFITMESYQFSADIAAVGRSGRGYGRVKMVFDTRKSTPRIIYRQDLSAFGWALGPEVRDALKQAKETWL